MDKEPKDQEQNNVIDFPARKPLNEDSHYQIIRLAPELDGMQVLYSNDANPGKWFSMSIIGWALMKDGSVDALIPWCKRAVPARKLKDPLNGRWEGYYDTVHDRASYGVPEHKKTELDSASRYFQTVDTEEKVAIQEIPDTIGTHAVFSLKKPETIAVVNVTSWRLYSNGEVQAMIADEEKIKKTPILPGDESLFPVQDHEGFYYFFHYDVANTIKNSDVQSLAELSNLLNPK